MLLSCPLMQTGLPIERKDTRPPPLTLRGVTFDPPLFCAPMVEITHSAFRRLLADFGGYGALFTEMLSDTMLLRENLLHSPWTRRRPTEHRLIYQLLVTNPDRLPSVIDHLLTMAPDAVDLNAACGAYTVCRFGAGAALCNEHERFQQVVRILRNRLSIPFTVKLRLGRETPDWRKRLRERLHILAEEGVDAVILHPRFVEEKFKRSARHALYPELAAEAGIPVIANGDITGREYGEARAADFAPTAGMMIGRMAACRPWIFAQWNHPGLMVDPFEVWTRLADYIEEDFPRPAPALARIKIFTTYYARNFAFGHTLFSGVQSAPDFRTARERAARFFESNPALCDLPMLRGI